MRISKPIAILNAYFNIQIVSASTALVGTTFGYQNKFSSR